MSLVSLCHKTPPSAHHQPMHLFLKYTRNQTTLTGPCCHAGPKHNPPGGIPMTAREDFLPLLGQSSQFPDILLICLSLPLEVRWTRLGSGQFPMVFCKEQHSSAGHTAHSTISAYWVRGRRRPQRSSSDIPQIKMGRPFPKAVPSQHFN